MVLAFLLAASDILGFFALSSFLRDVLLYLPNLIIAILIMVAAFIVANLVRHIVRASVLSAKLHAAKFLGSAAWWIVIIFGALAALVQLGIAVTIINTLITGFIAMLAIAGGLAFGLGGKDYAAHIVKKIEESIGHE
jgi:small-conductance mechanosensitive channel